MTVAEIQTQSAAAARTPPGKKPTSPYVLLFCILVVAAIATWIIPAGEFQRVLKDGVNFVVPGSLHVVPQHGVLPGRIFTAIATGVVNSASIIFLILFTGGTLAVLEKTGTVAGALHRLSGASRSGDLTVIVIVCAIFSLLGTLGIVANSVVAFVPLGLLIASSMNLPVEFGVGLIYLGAYSGFNSAVLSPLTTGLSQRLAELPLFSGMELRAVVGLCFLLATILFLAFYARRCRARNIGATMTQEQRAVSEKAAASQSAMSGAQWLALALAAVSLVVFIVGTLRWKWGEPEMTAMFLIIAIGGGLICRMGPSEIADEFLRGSGKLVPGAFIVGLARAISIVLADGKILDPIVNALSSLLEPLSPMVAAVGMFVSAAAMHVAISSGSGESAALIPIFAPLGDALHLTRQVTVQSVLLGEGIMNCINPTSGVLMAVLATSGIAYGRWVRFVLPLVGAWFVISVASLIVGVWIHWGPL